MDALTRYKSFREFVARTFSVTTQQAVDKALVFAAEKMEQYSRYNGRPLLDHDVAVGEIVAREIGLGRNSTVAAILHDVMRIAVKEQPDTVDELTRTVKAEFGEQVLGIIVGLCKISNIKLKVSKEQADDFRDMIVSYSEDPRVILIKLADRLEVMRNLDIFPPEKRRKKSWESLNLYAQIAHKLGLYALKSELEDLALKWLENKDYEYICRRLEETESERQTFIARFLVPIEERLKTIPNLKYHIKSRTKSVYSIWNKMRKQNVGFEGVYDIFALRIIIDCEREMEKQLCWTIYSVVSDCYTPNPKRMRDWVTIPKKNGYESLHTTVSAGEGRWVEIQIRSERMDAVAERGIAAHWRYKGVNQGAQTSEQWLGRLREALEETTHSLSQRFDAKPTSGEIFVFTPNGDIRKLPEGATVLDFAFDIHTNLGSTCTGGKVNNRAVPIREVLRNGDIVEVMTQKNQTPKADWLSFCVTSKARSRIKSFIREEQMKFARQGREELERKLKNWKLQVTIDEAVAYLCKHYKVRTGREIYSMIATQKIEFLSIKEILQRWLSGEVDEERRAAAAEADKRKEESKLQDVQPSRSSDALVIDEKINNIEYKLAKCCNPIKGDDIFGFVTISSGITIHRTDCPNAARLKENYPYRVMEARWRSNADGSFRATIAIIAQDMAGLANQITEIVTRELKLNIRGLNFSSRADGTAYGTVSVEVSGATIVDTLIHSIMKVKGVQRAYRVNN
ncbi:MAG: bifunctional (p)ppGpp synthetase/guanosine-3',5'-bis(diphosphate) 3'-pyrophosphohydrolase [Alistipes sp.]|nr:bifunctional (p)ppGpp synthetase/guanosine-3',5'-bis(diphosphate) 3'-pyrophosphohydrolase [Alistipes sp.]MBP3564486.1 bifunctional (p)ppGpp synthetase/guanosine-3',5'-bis(diphosphate) 3'-pyrophosphohydrolase [Alistipes sp.]